jgi:hypothetical protein
VSYTDSIDGASYQVNGNSGLPSSINPVVEVVVDLRLRVGVLVPTVAVVDTGCVLLGLTGT